MKLPLWFAALAVLAALLAGCGSETADGDGSRTDDTTNGVSSTTPDDGDGSRTDDDTGSESSSAFRPVDALLTLDDMPAGYIEIESTPGEGICGFRLVELADNGSRATFQSGPGDEFLEQVVLLFESDAADAMGQFQDVVDDCATTTADRYTLAIAQVEVDGIEADDVTAVEVTSQSGTPEIRALTVVARVGDEIVSITGSRSDRVPRESVLTAAARSLELLRAARAVG